MSTKKTWSVIKEAIRKKLLAIISKKSICGKKEITDIKCVAENFNRYFTEIGPTLVKKVNSSSVNFHKCLEAHSITQPEKNLTVNELKDTFFSLKLTKDPGYDEVSFNVRNVSEVCINLYFIYLMLHYKMELFQMS